MNGQLEKPMQKYMLVEDNSKPHDNVIYTDGSVTKDQSGWGFTVKQGGRTVHEDSGAHRVTTSSLTMEVEAVTHAIRWLASQRDAQVTHAIILTEWQTQWTSCKRWSLEWAAPTVTRSHAQSSAKKTSVDLLSWAHWSQCEWMGR